MSHGSRMLAGLAGAALILGSTGVAVGQEESPPPDGTVGAEASAESEMVEPSTLEIIDIAAAKTARQPLKGKKLKKAIAMNAPAVARYYVDGMGVDDIERIVEMSLQARALDEAGDRKAAQSTLELARLLYRNAWSRAKTDPLALNSQLESFIEAGDYQDQDPALALWTFGDEGLVGWADLCMSRDSAWFYNPATPSLCADDGNGRMVRVDFSLIDQGAENGSLEIYTGDPKTADAGGLGIHKIVQHKTANDKLAGKKFKKAWAQALKKHGPTIATRYDGGPGASPERRVIELVLAARVADEEGNPKAAKALMQLALVAYRSGVPAAGETGAYNESIIRLINEEYVEQSGLELWPPPGMIDVCYTKQGEYVTCVDQASPWECWGAGGSKLERMSLEEATCG